MFVCGQRNKWTNQTSGLDQFLHRFSLLAVEFNVVTLTGHNRVLQGSVLLPTPHTYLAHLPTIPTWLPAPVRDQHRHTLHLPYPIALYYRAAALAIFSESRVECHHLRQAALRLPHPCGCQLIPFRSCLEMNSADHMVCIWPQTSKGERPQR